MKIYISLDENGYIDGWGSTSNHVDNEIEIELDDAHEFFKTDHQCWKYVDGELVFDEEKQKQLIEEYEQEQNKPTEQERIEALENALLEMILND